MGADTGSELKPVQLKRNLGLFSAVNLILGTIIGSGIFISPTSALRYSGSVAMCIIVWGVCGIISLIGALAYAELGTLVPRSGSEYAYFMISFGPLHTFWGRLPAFLCSLIRIVAIRPASTAIILLTFSKYLCQPIFNALCVEENNNTEIAIKFIALLALGLITFININNVKVYVHIQNVFAFFKVAACLVVIIGGIYEIAVGNTENLSQGFEGTTDSPGDIALAFYSGLWAYDGWQTATGVTEEVKKPEVNILRSILISVPVITVLYVFMNVAYMTVLSFEEMITVDAVAVTFGERVLGSFAFVIPVGVAISTFGCALSLQFHITRLCYVSGQDGLMLQFLSYVHYKRLTPSPAVVFQALITIVLISTSDVTDLIQFASFLLWVFYGLAMVSLLILRRTMRDVYRPYKVPIPIPILVILLALYLSVIPIVMSPSLKYLFALGIILVGTLLYFVFVYKKVRLDRFMDGLTHYIQVLYAVVPTESMELKFETKPENKLEDTLEDKSEDTAGNKSKGKSKRKSQSKLEDKLENESGDKSENKAEDRLENNKPDNTVEGKLEGKSEENKEDTFQDKLDDKSKDKSENSESKYP